MELLEDICHYRALISKENGEEDHSERSTNPFKFSFGQKQQPMDTDNNEGGLKITDIKCVDLTSEEKKKDSLITIPEDEEDEEKNSEE